VTRSPSLAALVHAASEAKEHSEPASCRLPPLPPAALPLQHTPAAPITRIARLCRRPSLSACAAPWTRVTTDQMATPNVGPFKGGPGRSSSPPMGMVMGMGMGGGESPSLRALSHIADSFKSPFSLAGLGSPPTQLLGNLPLSSPQLQVRRARHASPARSLSRNHSDAVACMPACRMTTTDGACSRRGLWASRCRTPS
jgi:hypothetical protein